MTERNARLIQHLKREVENMIGEPIAQPPAEQHSPGPFDWWDRFGRKNGTGPATPGANILGDPAPTGQGSHNSYVVSDPQGFVVARCAGPLVTMSSERSEANARLLAASYDLLDFVQGFADASLQSEQAGFWGTATMDRIILHARALVKKIEGGAEKG